MAQNINAKHYVVLNHTSPNLLTQFRKYYPKAADKLKKLPLTHHKGQGFPCIIGKTARAPFPVAETREAAEPLDTISTETIGTINPKKGPHGNN